ncbi:MAG: hypothetical protein K8S22_06745 [Betaproteobacteria bacterium]|nr:hypothetical protein [Betaproteobacteria bacterium]
MSKELPELPQIISDEEFDRLLDERKHLPRSEHERWDNSAIRPGHEPGDGLPECCIEQQFPRIADKLLVLWPSEACAVYISSLLVNKRETRQGFPKEVVEDLLMLHAINDMLVRSGNRTSRVPAPPPPFSELPPRRGR